MAVSLVTVITSKIDANYQSGLDLVTVGAPLVKQDVYPLANGTGASQADRMFSDTRTLGASANEDLDLAGSLVDAFGAVLTFVKVKALKIKASAANTNNVVVKPAAATGWLGPFNLAASSIAIPPGGEFMVLAPVNGWAVGAGATDLLNVANSAAGTSVTYDIVIVGTSA
jgi:hypothetical protein